MKPKRKKLFIALIIILSAAALFYLYVKKPVRVDFFNKDCGSFEGFVFNNTGVEYPGVSVTVHYKLISADKWESVEKHFKGVFLPERKFRFRLCGEEIKKIEKYYFELKKEKL